MHSVRPSFQSPCLCGTQKSLATHARAHKHLGGRTLAGAHTTFTPLGVGHTHLLGRPLQALLACIPVLRQVAPKGIHLACSQGCVLILLCLRSHGSGQRCTEVGRPEHRRVKATPLVRHGLPAYMAPPRASGQPPKRCVEAAQVRSDRGRQVAGRACPEGKLTLCPRSVLPAPVCALLMVHAPPCS